jgi:sulfite exporter TauE/SafE
MNRNTLLFAGFVLSLVGELLGVAGIAITSQLISQNDPVAKSLSGAFMGLLLIMFGIMVAFYRISERK